MWNKAVVGYCRQVGNDRMVCYRLVYLWDRVEDMETMHCFGYFGGLNSALLLLNGSFAITNLSLNWLFKKQ